MRHRPGFHLVAGLLSLFCVGSAGAGVIEDHFGKWLGKVNVPNGPTLRTGIELFARADGSPGANFVSPDQGQFNIPVDRVSLTDDRIELTLSALGIHVRVEPKGDALVGEAQQGNIALPLELRRVTSFGEPSRPQTPASPLPYQTEELVVTAADGVKLAGTLSRPNGDGRVTAVVLLHGSGPFDRDESFQGHHWFAVLADYLTRQGIAVYRYDKRGVMHSTGDYNSTVAATLADDGFAAVKALRARKDISRVGIIGHSEGGELAPMIAASHPRSVDFLVSLAGPGLSGRKLIELQDRVGYERRGLSAGDIDVLMNYGRQFYDAVSANADLTARASALSTLHGGLGAPAKLLVEKYASTGTLNPRNAATLAERTYLMSETPPWDHVKCPVLALDGTLDIQVPPNENLGAIKLALADGGNTHGLFESLSGLNHMFQTAKTGLVDEYGNLDETISPLALQRISAFVKAQH
jgi:uncharacterized protein